MKKMAFFDDSRSRLAQNLSAPLFVLTLNAALLSGWADNSVLSSVAVTAILFFCCYVPARAVFHPETSAPTLPQAVVYTVAACLGGLSILSMIGSQLHVSPKWAAIPLAAAGLCCCMKSRSFLLPAPRLFAAGCFILSNS